MRYVRLLLAGILLFSSVFFTACTAGEQVNSGYEKITAQEAYERINENQEAVILDVRTQEEYDEGHINGALLLPNESIGTDKPAFLTDMDAEILIYCRSGNRSKQAAEKLAEMGYKNVKEFGGIQDWTYGLVTGEAKSEEKSKPAMNHFESIDLDGNSVTQEIFSEYSLTMVNVWGTYCSPCLKEMPDLGKISREYREKKVQIIGIPIDVLERDGSVSEDKIEIVKEIVKDTDASYLHILPSEDLIEAKLQDVDVIPYTFFVNSTGEIVGKQYAGSKSEKEWKKIIKAQLEKVGE